MLDVENAADKVNYTKLATAATNIIVRELAKTPVAPVLMASHPARQRMLRDIRSIITKHNGTVTLYVHVFSTRVEVGYTKGPGQFTYEVIYEGNKLVVCRSAASVPHDV